tara:strand:+ start:9218 stop:10468 length:1251 start_codon:yes stop_codon:yes gene_type:complete
MSNFIPYEKSESSEWDARQEAFAAQGRGGRDYAADVVQRGGTGFSSSVGHPEHLADFRRFALNKGSLFVPRFDVFVAHVDDLATRYTQVIPKIEKDGDELLHAMYINKDPIKVGVKGVKNIYLCLEGYNESEDQFIENQLNRNGTPWFIVEEAYLVYEEGDMPDEHGVVGQEEVKKYVKVGTFNTKTQFCETYIGQEMYLHYHAPKPPGDAPYDGSEVKMTNWWQPTFDLNIPRVTIGVGLNLIPGKCNDVIQPSHYWKREFYTPVAPVALVAGQTTYIWVKANMYSHVYKVADHIMFEESETSGSGSNITFGQIDYEYTRSNSDNDVYSGSYDIVSSQDIDGQTADTGTDKLQYLGHVTLNAGGEITQWNWRLNHALYWHFPSYAVGSYGRTERTSDGGGNDPTFDSAGTAEWIG